MSEPFSFEDFLAQQNADYRLSLPGRLAALQQAWQAVQASEGDAAALVGLERVAHALAGSAATFGLPAIGDAARGLEEALAPESTPRPVWDTDFSRLVDAKLNSLADLLESEIAQHS